MLFICSRKKMKYNMLLWEFERCGEDARFSHTTKALYKSIKERIDILASSGIPVRYLLKDLERHFDHLKKVYQEEFDEWFAKSEGDK